MKFPRAKIGEGRNFFPLRNFLLCKANVRSFVKMFWLRFLCAQDIFRFVHFVVMVERARRYIKNDTDSNAGTPPLLSIFYKKGVVSDKFSSTTSPDRDIG